MSSGTGVWAVLVAAGRGERFGGDRPKAFAKLGDRPLLAESLERLDRSDWVESIVIVAPPEWEEPSILVAEEIAADKVRSAVTGGATRAESVRAGLEDVPDEAAVVLVHDAARPILPERGRRAGRRQGSRRAGTRSRRAFASRTRSSAPTATPSSETVDRTGLVAVQTPQAFMAERVCAAHTRTGARRPTARGSSRPPAVACGSSKAIRGCSR